MRNVTALVDTEKRIGTVTKVTASIVELTLPVALAAAGRRGLSKGTIGDFVFVDCDSEVLLGRVFEVSVPEKQRPSLEHQIERDAYVEPQGRVQLLATVSKTTHRVSRGINTQPRVGDGVYQTEGRALSAAIKDALAGDVKKSDGETLLINLGQLAGIPDADISIPPEKLFGRHCGVFGATGGGKSWTVSRLVNEVVSIGGKCVLFDPTGEFTGRISGARECAFADPEAEQSLVHFPAEKIAEIDLFALLRPSGQTQAPVMREAINSLRLVRAIKDDTAALTQTAGDRLDRYHSDHFGNVYLERSGTLEKAGKLIADHANALEHYRSVMSAEYCDFDIYGLPKQILNECVFPTDRNDQRKFGATNDTALAHCNTLYIRAKTLINSRELQCMFATNGQSFCDLFENFLSDAEANALVVSFKNVSFSHNTRELLLNTVGRYLLSLARANVFKTKPLVCFLDEAHQFIGRSVGDEFNSVTLDAFGLIAKEGRKYGLTTTIATQRPRDVPQDVLSQLGTLFVHRLTNERDRETIEKACGDMDRSAAAFIPSLAQGEVIVVGPDLPAPLPIRMIKPENGQQPESHGPRYQEHWGRPSGQSAPAKAS